MRYEKAIVCVGLCRGDRCLWGLHGVHEGMHGDECGGESCECGRCIGVSVWGEWA